MTITINGSGSITGLSAGGLPDATIQQADLATGVAGTGPAFSAYAGSNQTVTTTTWTKIQTNTEEFDTASCFNNTGSTVGSIPAYAFLPNVAGYYQITATLAPTTALSQANIAIYKNGSKLKATQCIGTYTGALVTAIVYLNGSSDYIEAYAFLVGTTPTISGTQADTYFQASMARAA